MTDKIKQTISKGQAIDIADANLYNNSVNPVSNKGDELRNSSRSKKEHLLKDDSLYRERTNLDNDFYVNNIYTSSDSSLWISPGSYDNSITINGQAREDRRGETKHGNFTLYFKNREEVIEFAEKCLDAFAIQEAEKSIRNDWEKSDLYENTIHPEAYAHYPNLEDKLKIESGKFYWDESKLVEITNETDEELLDSLWYYDTDDEGNFTPSYWNEQAEQKLEGFAKGKAINWESEEYQGINLSNLATFYTRGYDKGYYHTKRKLDSDKRKKKDVTVFVFADRTIKEIDGVWNITSFGTLRRDWR